MVKDANGKTLHIDDSIDFQIDGRWRGALIRSIDHERNTVWVKLDDLAEVELHANKVEKEERTNFLNTSPRYF